MNWQTYLKIGLVLSFVLGLSASNDAQDVSVDEAVRQVRKEAIVERLKRAYHPVSIKLEGAWVASFPDGTENWIWKEGKWKCENSRVNCAEWVPVSFLWFSQGKGWLSSAQPERKVGFDLEGAARVGSRSAPQTEEENTEEPEASAVFEGKRNALELWDWSASFLRNKSFQVGLSLRDFMIERIQSSDQVEVLDWAPSAPNSKSLGLQKVMLERSGMNITLSRK